MYGDVDYDPRRSYIANSDDSIYVEAQRSSPSSAPDTPLSRALSTGRPNGLPAHTRNRQPSNASTHEHGSPTDLSRSSSTDTATQHFPLHDIDYESSPAAVAQELSNLQAIRRMSMNVDAADPDLPSFSSNFTGPPSSTPSNSTNDEAGLFWVPARLHPELAPKEFKTFVEDRVDLIRRRSGSSESKGLSPDGDNLKLNRRRSMLSKTIDSSAEFQDGADLLERKKSLSSPLGGRNVSVMSAETSLSELETLVNDPADLVRKLSVDSARQSLDTSDDNDPPMMAQPMGAAPLKRSTRTNYRRGSLKKGERVPYSSKRAAGRRGGEGRVSEDGVGATSPPSTAHESKRGSERTSTEVSSSEPSTYQRGDASSQLPSIYSNTSFDDTFANFGLGTSAIEEEDQEEDTDQTQASASSFHSRFASNGRTTAAVPPTYSPPPAVPAIVETPPLPDPRQSHPSSYGVPSSRPERTSSRDYGGGYQSAGADRLINHAGSRKTPPNQTLTDMANHPSMMPGSNMDTNSLSFIPTFDEGARSKSERDRKKDRKTSLDSNASKKSGWGWLLGNDDKSKDKSEESTPTKKSKARAKLAGISGKTERVQSERNSERPYDNTRLDVLQTSSDSASIRGRESLVLDRESIKLDDDRRRDGSRKSSESTKKEPGIFASIFGGKKKGDRDSTGKKGHSPLRGLSPSPGIAEARILRPDIDYNWTRFSILEERAIYRMAHIKLANPRRALHSQVLLSNFMYSYLAKVQQMHPQIQIPQFIQQKNSQRQQQQDSGQDTDQEQQQSQQQVAEFSAWQRYQEVSPRHYILCREGING